MGIFNFVRKQRAKARKRRVGVTRRQLAEREQLPQAVCELVQAGDRVSVGTGPNGERIVVIEPAARRRRAAKR